MAKNPRGGNEERSYDSCQPNIRIPRKVLKGGSCRRERAMREAGRRDLVHSLALLVIVVGTLEAFVNGLRVMFSSGTGHVKRDVWLRYARWLVVGLTF
jgi:hypothetical protein